jgi:hypothetical protein
MTKSTGVGRGNNPASHEKRASGEKLGVDGDGML